MSEVKKGTYLFRITCIHRKMYQSKSIERSGFQRNRAIALRKSVNSTGASAERYSQGCIQRVTVSNNCTVPQVHDAKTLGTYIHGIIANSYLQQGNPGAGQTRCAEKLTTGGNYRADIGTTWTANGNLARQGEIKPETQVQAGKTAIDNVAADNAGGAPQVNLAAWAANFDAPLGFNTDLEVNLRNNEAGYPGLYIYDCS